MNLDTDAATINVSASGYFPYDETAAIQRGENEVSVTLKRDPFGLLSSDACANGEELLYIEDFQDGKAQGWGNVTAATDYAAQNGWAIIPDEDGNLILAYQTENAIDAGDNLQDFTFDKAVWRLKVRFQGDTGFSGFTFLNWRHAPTPDGETRYPVQFGGDGLVDLTRLQSPDVGHFSVVEPASDQYQLFGITSRSAHMTAISNCGWMEKS